MAVTRTEMEMERGRVIAEKARRASDLERYQRAGKVQVKVESHPVSTDRQMRYGFMAAFYVDGVRLYEECTANDDYPSEQVMARLALAIGATVGFDGISPPEPTHKVSEQSKAYNARLREYNKDRWK